MNEEFLHYIWQHKLYKPELITTDEQRIEVIHPGTKNTDGGPDFFNAKIKIGNTLWAGNVEIHYDEKEWYMHQHHLDSAYDNVILHVVQQNGSNTINSKKREIPVCQIQINEELRLKYQQLQFNELWIPCEHDIANVDTFTLKQWIERLLIERLEEKNEWIEQLLIESNNNWDQVFFVLLCRSFGFGINGLPFELMARQTPFTILLKHADNPFQLEAILFGQAGFLKNELKVTYSISLKKEYDFLKTKYDLTPINNHLWKFLRLRPNNFPTIRIAQLTSVISKSKGQFDKLLCIHDKKTLLELLNVEPSKYWKTHYRLDIEASSSKTKSLGKSSQLRIIYNTIIPYLFIYAVKHNNEEQKEKIIDYLYQQPPEKNAIIDKWKAVGITPESEATAQSLIHLKSKYCKQKKCLSCHIGHEVLCKT
ncbi:DUF2851 family protein [Carboxylicivirga marina]|uniref:DUF2851 family protein n=1 Tax=Carboxylicivirga marina TaxID=2800988 RepID=A0ABS1HL36_9BACT|nr:DUF2851 family protein [Carboxylicivirga marina]MBK3518382.1 DUF2851 family protein [Carboxylicivirga marina]